MPVEIAVTRASSLDAASMAAIHRSCFAKAWDETAMTQFLGSPEALCLIGSVADSSGGMLGGLLIARKAADEAEILTLCVAPACRNAGLGRALLVAAMAELRAAGTQRLFLEVEDGNDARHVDRRAGRADERPRVLLARQAARSLLPRLTGGPAAGLPPRKDECG